MVYKTHGTCSREIHFDVNDNKLTDVSFVGGCNGNLKGIGKLVEGMDIVDQICAAAANWDRNPETGVITTLSQQPVIESIRILD